MPSKRYVSGAENLPPVRPTPKQLAMKGRARHGPTHRRKTSKTYGAPNPKLALERSRKRERSVRLNVESVPKSVADIEMKPANISKPASPRNPMSLPRTLVKPPYKEVSDEALISVEPELVETPKPFLREQLRGIGPVLFSSLSTVKADPAKDKLTKELPVYISDNEAVRPSHMLAVFGPDEPSPSPSEPVRPRKVTMFPVHSLILAAHCANLPPFPPVLPGPVNRTPETPVTLPVWPIRLPFPTLYPALSAFLYMKRTDLLFRAFFPMQAPALDKDYTQVRPFARCLAERFTAETLAKYVGLVFGLWRNMCALGIHDGDLWDALDLMWDVYLYALAYATGNPDAVDRTDRAMEAAGIAAASTSALASNPLAWSTGPISASPSPAPSS